MSVIEPKNSLSLDLKKYSVIKEIYDKLITIENFKSYRDDLEFLAYTCTMVEHLVINKKNKGKMDKKEIVFTLYEKLFGTISKENIGKNIEFLLNNKRIKKLGVLVLCFRTVKDYILKKYM